MIDPRFTREAEYGSKCLVAGLENRFGEMLTYFVTVEYKICDVGCVITHIDYWPRDPDMRESVEDYVNSVF
jgi:hypothetical protein